MTADLKSLIHGMSAAQVATAQAAHDARQPEIERLKRENEELKDALWRVRVELAALVPFPAIKGWQPTSPEHWMPALGNNNESDAECLQRAYDLTALAKAGR